MINYSDIKSKFYELKKKLVDNLTILSINRYVELINDLTAIVYNIEETGLDEALDKLNDFEFELNIELEQLNNLNNV